jgi:hypothetical protein
VSGEKDVCYCFVGMRQVVEFFCPEPRTLSISLDVSWTTYFRYILVLWDVGLSRGEGRGARDECICKLFKLYLLR